MYPKNVAPPEVTIQRSPVEIDGLYYPAHAARICGKDHEKWQKQLNTVLPIALDQVKDFSLAIDGGAFIGAWSRVLRFETVMAFEPLAENCACIEKNAPGVAVFKYALSDHSGTVDLYIKDHIFATSRKKTGTTTHPYRCTTIDTFHVEPGLIKLDLDGCDLAALKGAQETLERCSPVIIVEHKMDAEGIKAHMKSIDYREIFTNKRDSIWTR